MTSSYKKYRVGELRPSQLLFTYGIGSIIDLPHISTMVMGLDDWASVHMTEIGEVRLLQAVKAVLGPHITKLAAPPAAPEQSESGFNPLDESASVGVPVAPFPRWMVCPRCRRLAALDSGLFQLKAELYRTDRVRYVHTNCSKAVAPPVLPARFLVVCEHGHLDDFPWVYFVHRGESQCRARLRLREVGVSGEAAEIEVECEVCNAKRRMSDAFGSEGKKSLPVCSGRRPHLRDYEIEPCEQPLRTILLGASNSWFPIVLSTLAVPTAIDRLGQLVDEHWHILEKTTSQQNIELLRLVGQLPRFSAYSDADIWTKVDARKTWQPAEAEVYAPVGLKVPEWHVLSHPEATDATHDFKVTRVPLPTGYESLLKQVVLVERLRVVQSLIGFTRIESPGDATDGYGTVDEMLSERLAPLSRRRIPWVPTAEVRGEGIFIEFAENAIEEWLRQPDMQRQNNSVHEAHRKWRAAHHIKDPELGYPGLRYVLLHSFSHALIRQLTLECGYTTASIRERIYSLSPEQDGPMAGVLLYTSAPDSEGTLGGLVSLGQPEQFGRHIDGALEQMQSCASDPLCAEHSSRHEHTLHEAACHACLFIPETSCERGNKYLDRSVLVPTVAKEQLAFFALV